MIKQFDYRAAHAADSGSAPPRFVNALIETRRFFRNARGQILFLCSTKPQDEFVALSRRDELRAILDDGKVLTVTGDPLDDNAYAGFWFWLHDRRWMLPSASARGACVQS